MSIQHYAVCHSLLYCLHVWFEVVRHSCCCWFYTWPRRFWLAKAVIGSPYLPYRPGCLVVFMWSSDACMYGLLGVKHYPGLLDVPRPRMSFTVTGWMHCVPSKTLLRLGSGEGSMYRLIYSHHFHTGIECRATESAHVLQPTNHSSF